MKQFSKLMLIVLSFEIVTLALSLVPSKPVGAAGSAPVTVTNTPLPIQGTVNAAQGGPWNVGISGTPSVNISNSASSPVLQRNADAGTLTHVGQKASNLVGLFTSSSIFDLEGYTRFLPDGSRISNFTIPAGRALVVTDVHWSCAQPAAGTEIFFDLLSVSGFIIFDSQATANSNGTAHASEHLTSGVVVTGQLQHPAAVQCGFGRCGSTDT